MVSFRSNLGRVIDLLGGLVFGAGTLESSDDDPDLMDRWFLAQGGIKTWSADLVQVRKLKALKEPLRTAGKVWFSSPKHFRWEIGSPPQTVAVREDAALVVLYPRLKRAERYPLDDDSTGQWRDALTLLESGFPQSRAEMEAQFELENLQVHGTTAEFSMIPKSASTRKLLKEVRIGFNTEDMMLRSTEYMSGTHKEVLFTGRIMIQMAVMWRAGCSTMEKHTNSLNKNILTAMKPQKNRK